MKRIGDVWTTTSLVQDVELPAESIRQLFRTQEAGNEVTCVEDENSTHLAMAANIDQLIASLCFPNQPFDSSSVRLEHPQYSLCRDEVAAADREDRIRSVVCA